jgi:hypothetical protein
MKKSRKHELLLAVTAAFSASCLGARAEDRLMPAGTNTYYHGNILAGERFGIRIGFKQSAVDALSNRKFTFVSKVNCDQNLKLLFDCEKDKRDTFYLYSISQTFRNGTLIVEYENGHVYRLVWDCQLLPPVDF